MKLSDYKGEDAVALLGDIIEPISNILADGEFKRLVQSNDIPRIKAVQYVLKHHSKGVVEIMAAIDGVEPSKYDVDVFTLPQKLMELANDAEFTRLFLSQGQSGDGERSGSATGTTTANGQ